MLGCRVRIRASVRIRVSLGFGLGIGLECRVSFRSRDRVRDPGTIDSRDPYAFWGMHLWGPMNPVFGGGPDPHGKGHFER